MRALFPQQSMHDRNGPIAPCASARRSSNTGAYGNTAAASAKKRKRTQCASCKLDPFPVFKGRAQVRAQMLNEEKRIDIQVSPVSPSAKCLRLPRWGILGVDVGGKGRRMNNDTPPFRYLWDDHDSGHHTYLASSVKKSSRISLCMISS